MTEQTTYQLAVANGAGLLLTDGKELYKVSDWSPSDRQVYGHVRRGVSWERYQKLRKTGLRIHVEPAETAAAVL